MKKILVVEDGNEWQDILCRWFREWGYEVVGPASHRREALALFRAQKPDLVTMDGQLPYGDTGLDIASAIRKEDDRVPIVMITGQDTKFEGRGFSKGRIDHDEVRDYLSKILS